MSKQEQLIELLKKNQVIRFGEFTLSSGKKSDYYVDMKRAVTNPDILNLTSEIITEKLDGSVNKIAGPALGAIPLITAVSLKSRIPMLMIRSAKKDYGTSQLIEGDLEEGDLVVVLEDVTTTGKSLMDAIEAILEAGGKIQKAYVVVDRAEGAKEIFKERGIKFEPLISVDEIR
ncbi:MAG TPA: orotate phosphoribosyltransferase [Methanobacterium sp.]|nr:orotate phosphoribosyltransferase [Methanobacterium sp.]